MVPPWRAFVFLVVVFSLFSVMNVGAQPSGRVLVESDLELLSLGDISGGGRVTWTLTGEQAELLRAKVLGMFDGGLNVPRGFAFELQATGATAASANSGIIESAEAGQYLAYVENELEGVLRGFIPTDFRFVRIPRADRIESDLPAERSSSGLVGTSAATSENIEVRFIFNAETRTPSRVFDQADLALANALHAVFSFDATEDLLAPTCPPTCYPFPAMNGWRVVGPPPAGTFAYPPGPFLWHGNVGASPWNDTGAYPQDAWNVTWYSPTGGVEGAVDLSFATTANFTIEHTGRAAAGDVLLVQVSEDQVTWTNLTATNDGDGLPPIDGLDPAVLGTSVFDLDAWLGRPIYLRLNFTANGDATTDGPGFFVRNMRIQAPSFVEGTIDFRHVDYVVGFLSFSEFRTPTVKPQLIRTPVGEVMFYTSVYDAGDRPQDAARYATFDAVENPQILFVLLAVSAWLSRYFQEKAFERHRMRHPASLRAAAAKVKWLHWLRLAFVILLVLLYFFPTMLIGVGIVISGGVFWGLSIGFVVGLSGFSVFWYDRQSELIPPEPGRGERYAGELPPPPPPAPEDLPSRLICAHCDMDIDDLEDVHRCTCGQLYHKAHAIDLGQCGNCGRALEVELPPEARKVRMACPACGTAQLLDEGANPIYHMCSSCRHTLELVPSGFNYLVIADEPSVAYAWFNGLVRGGASGLCMSTTFPEKLRRQHSLPDVELYWLSDTSRGAGTLDPRRIDFEIMRAISNFVREHKGGAMVLDGLEYLIVENTFDRLLKFIKKVNDLASVHRVTLFVPITPTGLGPEEATLLRKEFDRVETIPSDE